MSDTKILTGPDGRYYEIPADELARYAVPGERVNEVRQRLGATSDAGGGMPAGHLRPGDPLPPGVPPPPSQPVMVMPGPSATTTIATPNGGTVVLNFFFGPPSGAATEAPPAGEVEGYHMTFGATGIPTNHVELMWGDYVDKQGHPQVGWHSHDPVTGNAQ
jgi:hypothetical protein